MDNSIHPRNHSTGNGQKSNTKKPMKDQKKGKFGFEFSRLQRRQQSHDMNIDKNNPLARRRPGSMRKG